MSIINSQPLIGASGQSTGYKIERSLRFNSADSAYLSRTPGSASNRKTFTYSAWIKRGVLNNGSRYSYIFTANAGGGGSSTNFLFNTNDSLRVEHYPGSTVINCTTNSVFRDPSAWYHIVFAVDTTQATNSNGIKIYVNGVQQTLSFSAYTQNTDTYVNAANQQGIGLGYASDQYFDGYQTEINFIDGQQLTPSSFGETDTDTGVWKPKAYSGSYGTNGFYLKFADNSGTTSTTLGKDSSGNGNNWTPNNFSVTAGAGNDSLVDTPTPYGTDTGAGGEVRGNYATMNPLERRSGTNSTVAIFTNGNLEVTCDNTLADQFAWGTVIPSSGKWYFECTVDAIPSVGYVHIGVDSGNAQWDNFADTVVYVSSTGNKVVAGSNTAYGATYTTNDVIGVALDRDGGTVTFYKNNSSQGSINLPTTSPVTAFFRSYKVTTSGKGTFNFGQRPFAYTAPSGYKALCTQNLPTPTIGATSTTQAGKYFNTVLYTGNGTTQSITGVGFQPDWVWIKSRSNAYANQLFDAVRGVNLALFSNETTAETNLGTMTAFNADGFSVSTVSGTYAGTNGNSATFAAWNWKANGAGAPNTDGSITSTVSANTTAGFSIVTYTGTGANATVGHGLGVAPSMIITKKRSSTSDWGVYHTSLGNTNYLLLDTTAASAASSTYWNNTSPTSTLFSIGTADPVNINTATYVAYCFAPVASYSSFGSYVGNGSSDGPMIYTGFRPAYVMIKPSSAVDNWQVEDNKRSPYNVVNDQLWPNLSDAEQVDGATRQTDFLSNGFKMRGTNTGINGNGTTYIYAAFASNPFKFSLAA